MIWNIPGRLRGSTQVASELHVPARQLGRRRITVSWSMTHARVIIDDWT
jgi:hypothetical protein